MPRSAAESLPLFDIPPEPTDAIERRMRRKGFRLVAGVDEAGRGPLAGPVVAAAVIFDQRRIPEGLDDSKKLSADERERLFTLIMVSAIVSVAAASVARIERTDIRKATLWAMTRAVAGLHEAPDHAIIDGVDVPPGLRCPGEAFVKGDSRSISIAAASIVAKVTRDRLMTRAASHFPDYGFDRHMGYGTPGHLEALTNFGACVLHRATFAPVRAAYERKDAASRPASGQASGVLIFEGSALDA